MRSFPLISLALVGLVSMVGCNPATSDKEKDESEHPCQEDNHCLRGDDGLSCEDGFTWENPSDESNFNCVPAQAGDGDIDDDIIGDGDGDIDPFEQNCDFPASFGNPTGIGSGIGNVQFGEVMFNGDLVNFNMKNFFCEAEWDRYETISVIMVAEWCPNCPQYVQDISTVADVLDQNNSLLVFWDQQKTDYTGATNTSAHNYITGYIGPEIGMRVGGGEASPQQALSMGTYIPNGFVIRKRDMKVIAFQENYSGFLPYWDIAADPEADWSGGVGFQAECDASDEEVYEPNNTPAEAPAIGTGTFEGGVCDQNADIFTVDIQGAWTATIDFSHATGDLDLFVVDDEGVSLERSEGTTNTETVQYVGPAKIAVLGYSGATGTYSLTLSE